MVRVNVLTVELRIARRRPHLVAAEFLIDGRPLLEHCEAATGQSYDRVSPFGWTPPDYQRALAESLLLRRPPLLSTGRQQFLVCPECADIGCGSITAIVRSEGDYLVWEQFGYENNYDPASPWLFPMGAMVIPEQAVSRLLSLHVPGLTLS
jgi:hypothetical protein